MTIYEIVMWLGVVVLLAIMIKGLWAGRRVEPVEQPDNWMGGTGGEGHS